MVRAAYVALLLLGVGCRAGVDVTHETDALLKTDQDWARLAAAGRAPDSLIAYWTDDARVVSPGQPVVSGKAAIRQMVTSSLAIPGFRITWTPEKAIVGASGDLGYTTGSNEVSVPDSTGKITKMVGRYITVWRRDAAGRWRCVEDYSSPGPVERPTGT